MSDAAAATAPEPVVLPPADVPPEPAAPKSFSERWTAVENTVEDEPAPAAAPAKTEPEKKPPPPAADKDAKRAQLKALASELGLELDEKGISTQEAIEVRAQKRKNLAWRAEQEALLAKQRTEWEAANKPKLERTERAEKAFESGDPDEFAQAFGAKDWNDLQTSFLNRIADPNYKEVQSIKAKLAEKEKAEEEAKKQAEQQVEAQRKAQARANYMKTLSEQCKASPDPLAQAMHDDAGFLMDVIEVQKKHWDPVEQKTISVEEAIKEAQLADRMKRFHDKLSKAFGAPPPAAPAAAQLAPVKNGKKPAPKTSVTPAHTLEGGAAPPKPSDPGWREWAIRQMQEAKD